MSDLTRQPLIEALDVAILMAQELQEFVDDAIECSGDPNSMAATRELLKDWEKAYAATGLGWQDHFAREHDAANARFVLDDSE